MDKLCNFILFFGNAEFIISLLVLGIYFLDRKIFINTLLIALCGIIVNVYLKSVFQIPLNPEIGKPGWAYPSGHSMFGVIFWGALFIQVRKPWVLLAGLAITIPNFFAMVYKRYHNWEDVFGGVCAGGLVLVGFYYWIRYQADKVNILAISTLVISLFIFFFLLPLKVLEFKWAKLTIGIHIGLCLTIPYIEKFMPEKLYPKVLAIVLAITSVYLVRTFMQANGFIVGAALSFCALMLVPGIVKCIHSKMRLPAVI